MFALRTSLGSVLDCVAPCLEESLLSLAKLRLEEVWKSFTEHTKRVDVWLKNDSEKRSVIFLRGFHKNNTTLQSPRECRERVKVACSSENSYFFSVENLDSSTF